MSDWPKPSTYTPLTRRFTNERDRELRETRDLYASVKAQHDAMPETVVSFARRLTPQIRPFPSEMTEAAIAATIELVSQERQMWEVPPPVVDRMTMQEYVEYRNLLYATQYFLANQTALFALLEDGIASILAAVSDQLPHRFAPSPFSVPLIHALPEPLWAVERAWSALADGQDRGLFRATCAQLHRNISFASGRNPDDTHSRRPFIAPANSSLPLAELVDSYFGGTPLRDLFLAPVPLRLSNEVRFSHMHVLGGSGSGKTTLIENLIRHDLASDDPPSIVVVDPHSDLVRKLARSDLGIEDRVILIDPRDTKYPLALNPFALNRSRLGTYDEVTREQVTAGVIETFGYLWSGLTNLTLTGKQDVLFRYVTRLMLSLPDVMGRNATILDMLKLMSDPAPYAEAIDQLPEIPRDFFLRDFASKGFEGTREQIRYRLQAIIENPTMARLFTAPETRVDFFTEMNRGAVILIDTAKDFLKEGSAIFGKLLISLILQAVMERAAIPEDKRKPTFIMVDEASTFFSSNIDDLLTEARKHKTGILLSHQFLDQGTSALRASIAANTAVKFASGLSAADASAMARDMRTTSDFILAQPRLQFAAYIRNVTPSAVSIPVEPVRGAPQLSTEAFAALLERNRARVSAPTKPLMSRPTATIGHAPENEDISREW